MNIRAKTFRWGVSWGRWLDGIARVNAPMWRGHFRRRVIWASGHRYLRLGCLELRAATKGWPEDEPASDEATEEDEECAHVARWGLP